MKKTSSILLVLLLLFQPLSFSAWDDTAPAGGSNASDIDTKVTVNNAALEATLSGITGWTNLKVTAAGSTTAVTVTADMLLLQASDSIAYRVTSVSETITITTAGASGLVTSISEAADAWYYVWIARKSSDGTVNGYLSTTTSLTTFLTQVDSGYDQAALVSVVRNSSGDFVDFVQIGIIWVAKRGRQFASGSTGSVDAWTSLDTTNYVPSALSSHVFGTMMTATTMYMTNDNTTLTNASVDSNKYGTNDGATDFRSWDFEILTANTLYWASTQASAKIYIDGFILNKL